VAAIRKPFKIEGGLVVTDSATIVGLLYPTTDGTSGQVLSTDGNGNLTFTNVTADDADTLDGFEGTYYLDYNNFTNTPAVLDSVSFADLTSTPTTLSGYGITDAFNGDFDSLSNTPTTLSGYGITDAPADLTDLGISDGTDGQVLTTDGLGNFTFATLSGGSGDSLLDHTPGITTASSALIVDSNKKLNELLVDNITIDGNEIASTNTDGNVSINPNGSGTVDVNSSRIVNISSPTDTDDAATKGYVDGITGGVGITLSTTGDTGTGSISLANSDMTFSGVGLTATVSGVEVSYALDASGVTPGQFGSTSAIPVVTVDSTGLVTDISTVGVAQAIDSAGIIELARSSHSVEDQGGDGAFRYDSASGKFTYTGPSATEVRAHFSGGTGVTITDGEIAIGQSVATNAGVTFDSITTTGSVLIGTNLTVDGDLSVNGGTTSVSTISYVVTDPLFHLADSNEFSDVVDIGFVAHYSPDGGVTKRHTGFFRDASNSQYYLFAGLIDSALDSAIPTNVIDRNGTGFALSDLNVGNIYATNLQGDTLVGDYQGFDSDFSARSTSDLTEGSNLYYTTARVDSDVTALVNKTFVDNLNIDADTLDNQNGTYYLDYANFTGTPNILDSANVSSIIVNTDLIDSADVAAIIADEVDSAYVQLHAVGLSYNILTGRPNVLDSADVSLIAGSISGLDSNGVSALVDSDYVQLHATGLDYYLLSSRPTTINGGTF